MLLSQTKFDKRIFNPKSKDDLRAYRDYVENRRWKDGCPFQLEWPYIEIPLMLQDKIINTYLDDLIGKK